MARSKAGTTGYNCRKLCSVPVLSAKNRKAETAAGSSLPEFDSYRLEKM